MYLDNKYHVIMERQAVDILNHMLDNIYHVMMERQAVDIINHMLDTVVVFFFVVILPQNLFCKINDEF